MNPRYAEYRSIIEDLVANLGLLDEDERAALASLLSSAETTVLATMANVMPGQNNPQP